MAEFTYNPIQLVAPNQNVIFNTAIGCPKGYVLHRDESGLVILHGRQDLTAGTLDVIDKLAHAAKNVDKIIESCEEEEYSGNMMGGRSYGYRGRSYARRSRDMRGRYSGTDYPDGMMDNNMR